MTSDSMEELYREIQLNYDIDNFLQNGIHPKYYSNPTRVVHSHRYFHHYNIDTLRNDVCRQDILHIQRKLQTNIMECNIIIETLKNINIYNNADGFSNNTHNNSCPICMDILQESSYVLPSCGHKLCIQCFAKNIHCNRQTGHTCSLCRKSVFT